MTATSLLRLMLFSTAVALAAPVFAAEDASMHQVYLAAEAGKMAQAQAMMDKVLHDHPNSAKAHFVEAELMAREGHYANAQAELATAERLAPGLPFAKPEAQQTLRNHIASAQARQRPAPNRMQASLPAPAGSDAPWGLILAGAGLIAFIVFAVRFMKRRNPVQYAVAPRYAASPAMQPYGQGGQMGMGGTTMGGMGGMGGAGSGLMGSLATGAALGAGLVAGEALMHHFTDGNRSNSGYEPPMRDDRSGGDDMGGNDFGIADNSSWDDASSGGGGGGDDWG